MSFNIILVYWACDSLNILFDRQTIDTKYLIINADDCHINLSYEPETAVHAIDQINSDLQSNSMWSKSSELKLNIGKCTGRHVAQRSSEIFDVWEVYIDLELFYQSP